MIWRGFGVCLVERMRLSLKALNGQALGLTSRHPRTAGSACRQLQESFVVGPLMATPVWRLLRAPLRRSINWKPCLPTAWALPLRNGGDFGTPRWQLYGKPTLLLSGKEEADHTEAFAIPRPMQLLCTLRSHRYQ